MINYNNLQLQTQRSKFTLIFTLKEAHPLSLFIELIISLMKCYLMSVVFLISFFYFSHFLFRNSTNTPIYFIWPTICLLLKEMKSISQNNSWIDSFPRRKGIISSNKLFYKL